MALSYRFWGTIHAEPVLFIHELGGSPESWALLARYFPDRAIYAPDLAEIAKDSPGISLSALADALIAAMRSLRPSEDWDIVGTALGGNVASQICQNTGQNISSFTLCGCAPEMLQEMYKYLADRCKIILEQGMAAAVEVSLKNSFGAATAELTPAFITKYRSTWTAYDPKVFADLSMAIADCDIHGYDMSKTKAPLQVIGGSSDFICTPDVVRRFKDKRPDARIDIVDPSGHFPHLQNPAAVAQILRQFWNSLE